MQIFIIGSILETASSLDKRRLWKQILEVRQIMKAIKGESQSWKNHPITKMYKNHLDWLSLYEEIFIAYHKQDYERAINLQKQEPGIRPYFLHPEYLENMKKRLYTKDNIHYSQWGFLGESYINLYYIDNTWVRYEQKV